MSLDVSGHLATESSASCELERRPEQARRFGRPRKGAVSQDAEREIMELRAENLALRAERGRLQRLIDGAAEHAIVTLNLKGRITRLNAGARHPGL